MTPSAVRVPAEPTILIVGGGYSGAAVAFHLARRSDPVAHIVVVEPRERLGGGLAYSSPDPSHRVNVPARRMSLSTEEPDGFSRWLDETQAAAADGEALALGGELFPQRSVFGRYVESRVAPFVRAGRIEQIRARAVAARREGARYRVELDDGRVLVADALVLAATHPPPSIPGPLRAIADRPGFYANPYDTDRLDEIAPQDRVLVVGTGLTMADTVASLDRRGHRGPILALSRHGWRSRGHPARPVEAFGDFSSKPAGTVGELFRRVRAELASAASDGLPWQAVFDALRQQGPAIWSALPAPERARLLRHGRTLWDVHRFRIAPQVEAVLDRSIAEGTLAVIAASLRSSAAEEDGALSVTLRRRHQSVEETRTFDRIVVTTGPGHGDVTRTDPLLASLVAEGEIGPDRLGLGIHTSRESRAIGSDDRARPSLFVAGPLGRATFGELMGLPEVTASAERVADGVARFIEDERTVEAQTIVADETFLPAH
ncbi:MULTISPECIES: FAD/NAD(P)-binding protein [unclassified Aureimonas]|uniref:FAD/NAD(P)-binding protein n=1 Tax=unclassified Aureimonas TaxID=2615206 RepID=UPI0006FF78DC|nr:MULTISPECIES: FAD/NAD(P)-binding protein [unclassified Aureimonas]KQT60494.1 hypothetical protein ASG62_07565 [Aureimonas sp. Leaf427]KQT79371.1 hypothetical protein ASG54_10165 [Aureimonas sp. Leaf460]